MSFQSTPYTALLLFSTVVSASLCVYALHRYRTAARNRAALRYFAVLMFAAAGWSLSYAIGLSLVERSPKLLWLMISNVWTVITPLAWFAFAVAYTNNEHYLTRRAWAALSIEPVVVAAVTMTVPYSDLYYYNIQVVTESGFRILSRDLGPVFVIHAAYSYALVLAGTILFVQFARLGEHAYRAQAVLLVGGSLLPVVSNAPFVFGLFGGHVNLTPLILGVSGVAFALAITRYRFLDLAPVARDTVVERMRDGYLVCDESGTVVDRNAAATRLLDVDEKLVGTNLAASVPDLQPALETAAHGSEYRSELVVGDGPDRRFLDVSASPLDSVDGTLVVVRDVTEQRRAERRFQTLIERSSDIITILDEDGTIEYISPSVERVLGIDPDVLVDSAVFDLVHPADRDEMRRAFESAVDDHGYVDRIEYRVANDDGDWRVHEAVGRNLLDDPDVEGIVVNSRDVTERKRREREVEAANERLAESNERLERFASVVSHDLRNPLTVASGYTEVLADRYDDPVIEEVQESHDRIGSIIEDVLALARGDDFVTDRVTVNLADVAEEAWENVETTGARLETTDLTVEADAKHLTRVFENLFRNSIEHARTPEPVENPSGGRPSEPDLVVSVGVLEDGDGFYVADNGPGIPPSIRDSIFEEGVSGSNGTGLGLAIVSDIVTAHGWEISVDEAADGARFNVRT